MRIRPLAALAAGAALALSISPAGAAAPSGTPVTIGAILSISGPFAPLGEPERNALQVAERDINATGGIAGHPLKIVIMDDEGKPDVSSQLATQLVSQHVIGIIGGTLTANTQAAYRVAEAAQVPEIFMTPTAQLWETKRGIAPYLFQSVPRNELETEKLSLFAKNRLGAKKIAVLYDENPYGQIGHKLLAARAKQDGLSVVAEEQYPTTASDLTPQLLKVQQSGADTVFLWGASEAPAIAARQIRQLKLKVHIVGATGILSQNFIRVAGPDAEGVYSDTDLNTTSPDAVEEHFIGAYRNEFKTPPNNFASFAWDAAHLFQFAAQANGGKLDGPSIVKAWETMRPYHGTTAFFKFTDKDHNGIAIDSLHMTEVKSGAWAVIKE
ncbi:hypothetical protein EPN42_07555 [bacterium]|nr:MAG: hypothetical protein EPN42_07555 [bacterium]